MARSGKKVWWILGTGILGLLLFSGCAPYTTGPNEVGVRTLKFAIFRKAGVEDKVYQPGSTYWFVPWLTDWHTFDTRLQVLEMVKESGKGDRKGRDDLLFKTIDGNDISLDVVISYRVIPEKAPYILQYVAQSNDALRENLVRTVTRSVPRDIFGELKTEEFYVASQRAAKAARAKEVLNKILNPYGVVIEKVLTRDYRFNPAYQRAIEDRKVADQQAEKAKSEVRATKEEYQRKLEEAIGEVNKMKAEADGRYQGAKIEADADFDKQAKKAEAINVEAETQAKALRKTVAALQGEGGEALVKLKLAEVLKGKPIMLLPVSGGGLDVKTTDINRLLEIYGLRKLPEVTAGGSAAKAPAEGAKTGP
jgi:regulator of protease activity HflC (stomatin/prohibitin superfamily)